MKLSLNRIETDYRFDISIVKNIAFELRIICTPAESEKFYDI